MMGAAGLAGSAANAVARLCTKGAQNRSCTY